ncbi:MAG: DEAD/DEAH box helicase, partial [Ferruginibacter sp.]
MNLDMLLKEYANDPRCFQIADRITLSKPQQIHLTGLYGSAIGFILSAVFNHKATGQLNHLVILRDAEEAAYFHNTFENLTHALDIFYFPSSFKNKKNYRLLNSSHVMLRTEALTRIAAGTYKKILITHPEALFEKVVLPKTLSENIISIKQSETLDVNKILEKFVDYGFKRTDFVYEPGQFAIRGGILDIYSFGNEKPYRIELFGNEVDSIRIFDPESQLSERKLLQVNIIPNVETQFDTGDKVSLLEFLPANTVIWTEDWQFIKEKIEQQEEDLELYLEAIKAFPGNLRSANDEDNELNEKTNVSKNDFVRAGVIEEQVRLHHVIEFGSKNYFSSLQKNPTLSVIPFSIKSQPAFNRQFDLLIKNLKEYETKKYNIYLFADNPKQLERLHIIFTDLKAEIAVTPVPTSIHEGFIDDDLKVVCYTDHQIFQRYHKYKVKQAFSKNKALTLKTLRELQPGDYVTHIDHGVGVYSGLQKIEANGKMQEAVRIQYKDGDLLYVNISSLHKIGKYSGKEGTVPKMNKLGSDVWNKLKEKTKKQVKDIATDLIKLYAERKSHPGFAHSPDNYMQTELEASFIYEDTPDQGKATEDVKRDMEKPSPMDRLVCGDVGFGKTEVAIRAAFKTCCDDKQAAILVPTTILAYQHYKTFGDRLKDFPVTVDFINRFKSAKEKKETLQKVAEGKIDIIIGTHSLLGKDVKFKDLGLMVIDEEQKFGVAAKEKLKQLRTTVDSLTLTATPIPRTLQFSLMGARDLSIINTPPPNRQPIQTEIMVFNEDAIREIIYYETERGGQVFFIHNRVNGLAEMKGLIQGLCPDISIAFAHGQMDGDQLEDTILDFMDRKYDVLVCTNIVESGVDIPNVNTIIVNNSHQFGLSDL